MKKVLTFIVCGLLLLSLRVYAADPVGTFKFKSPQEEAMYFKLSNELRCLVCQNESIANSTAGLAKDLRTEMYGMLQAGKSEKQIIAYMVDRYGDYVLYDPPVQTNTVLLWFGPVIVFFIAIFFVWQWIRSQQSETDTEDEMSASDAERLRSLQAQGRGHK